MNSSVIEIVASALQFDENKINLYHCFKKDACPWEDVEGRYENPSPPFGSAIYISLIKVNKAGTDFANGTNVQR